MYCLKEVIKQHCQKIDDYIIGGESRKMLREGMILIVNIYKSLCKYKMRLSMPHLHTNTPTCSVNLLSRIEAVEDYNSQVFILIIQGSKDAQGF